MSEFLYEGELSRIRAELAANIERRERAMTRKKPGPAKRGASAAKKQARKVAGVKRTRSTPAKAPRRAPAARKAVVQPVEVVDPRVGVPGVPII